MARRQPLFPIWPVALGTGIAAYFGAPWEPPVWGLVGLLAAAVVGAGVTLRWVPFTLRWLGLSLCVALSGAGWAGLRTHLVAAPVLEARLYTPVEGRVVAIDRSLSNAPRITLDRVLIPRRGPDQTPRRVRIALHGDDVVVPPPGTRVMMTAHLSPPQAPAEPGGFDFRRHAWFQGLGGVGYTRTPVLIVDPARRGWSLYALRLRLADAIAQRMGPQTGGVAAAIVTGYRAHLDRVVVEDLRAANLSHLLAISGLHMGLLAASVFALIRGGLALIPPLALRLPGKKIAAVIALIAACLYLALSGAGVATQRAFVMVAVMLGGVLLDRPALSLRSVALAALVIMTLRPEAVLGVGFQMSFAATTALVVAFAALRDLGGIARWHGLLRGGVTLALSSLVAGLATAPFAALAFHRLAPFGFPANLAAVPVMGSVVMPGALMAAIGWPLGGEGAGLAIMDLGLRWILGVAATVSDWPGAVTMLPAAGPAVLPMFVCAGVWGMVRVGRDRVLALPVLALALVLWSISPRPGVLIAESGGMIGVMTPQGRSLSLPRGEGFVTRSWLAADGDGRLPQEASFGWTEVAPQALQFVTAQATLWHLRGKTGLKAAGQACHPGAVVVVARFAPDPGTGCLWLDRAMLADRGAMARMPDGRWVGARDGPDRIWTRPGQ